jgi:hypothetical protein
MWPCCNLATSQRRPYCAYMNSYSPVRLVSRQWDAVWPSHSQISSLSMAILALGKPEIAGSQIWAVGGWQTWVIWYFAKKACMRAIELAGVLSWWSWTACSVILNVMVTQHTSSVSGISLLTADSRESDCSRMYSKVSSDWLPSYVKATLMVFKLFKMDGYFPHSLHMCIWPYCRQQSTV